MSLNIKNEEVVRLAGEVAKLAGESKTEAVRRALEERQARLTYQRTGESRAERLARFLETEAWPSLPEDCLGRRLDKQAEEEILGYGEHGV